MQWRFILLTLGGRDLMVQEGCEGAVMECFLSKLFFSRFSTFLIPWSSCTPNVLTNKCYSTEKNTLKTNKVHKMRVLQNVRKWCWLHQRRRGKCCCVIHFWGKVLWEKCCPLSSSKPHAIQICFIQLSQTRACCVK